MFSLHKWYLDLVTTRGDVVILYAARLRWGAFGVGYASVLEDTSDGLHREAGTIGRVQIPRRRGDELTWQNGALDVEGHWQGESPSVRRRVLASTPHGAIRWACHMPRARATARVGGVTHEGRGYVESLSLTIPPWKLPFDELRWGRYASDRHSLVWIDWRGSAPRSWVWLDGEEQLEAVVTDAGIRGLAGGAGLHFRNGRDIVDRNVLASLTGVVPRLTRRVWGRLGAMHEHKRVDSSIVVDGREPPDSGWTVHEVVTW